MIRQRDVCRALSHAKDHLNNALGTPDPEEKDIHIRLAYNEITASLKREGAVTRKEDNDKNNNNSSS